MKRRQFIGLVAATAAWPCSAQSQKPAKIYRLAIIHPTAPNANLTEQTHIGLYSLIFAELRRLGYIEDRNLLVERWTAEGKAERYEAIAGEVLARSPDAVFVPTGRMAMHFKRLTSTLPMVVLTGAAPMSFGLVESISRPGANITGVTREAGPVLLGKYFQILRDLDPSVKKVGFLAPSQGWQVWQSVLTSQSMGIAIVEPTVEAPATERDHRVALKFMIDGGIDGLVVCTAVETIPYRRMIIELVRDHRLPTIYPYDVYVNDGGLISYTSDQQATSVELAHHIDLVLKGTKPGDLPFLQATKFHLTINVGAARSIELAIPDMLFASADKLIE